VCPAPFGHCAHDALTAEVSYATMSKAGRMDLEENINAWLAHDPTMASVLPQQDFLPLKGDLEELTKFKKRTRAN
jgi:hypothetical protein